MCFSTNLKLSAPHRVRILNESCCRSQALDEDRLTAAHRSHSKDKDPHDNYNHPDRYSQSDGDKHEHFRFPGGFISASNISLRKLPIYLRREDNRSHANGQTTEYRRQDCRDQVVWNVRRCSWRGSPRFRHLEFLLKRYKA